MYNFSIGPSLSPFGKSWNSEIVFNPEYSIFIAIIDIIIEPHADWMEPLDCWHALIKIVLDKYGVHININKLPSLTYFQSLLYTK